MDFLKDFFAQYSIIIIPVLIFCARIIDVTFGTVRIIFISRGLRMLASILGFLEVIIWLSAIRAIMANLDSPVNFIAYGAGFAVGNYVGISIENKISIGTVMIRIITQQDAKMLIRYLREHGFGVTCANAQGGTGPVQVVFSVIPRSQVDTMRDIIRRFNPKAFYTIEDVRYVTENYPSLADNRLNRARKLFNGLTLKRK